MRGQEAGTLKKRHRGRAALHDRGNNEAHFVDEAFLQKTPIGHASAGNHQPIDAKACSKLQEKLGVAYLFIAHDLLVVHHISDRIAVMYLGRIVEIADADDLNESPIHPYTQSLLSAVPYPDPKMAKERQRIILEGDVPSPLHMPTGCAFRTRCKYATERCAKECPTLTDRGNGHMVACFNK